MSEVNPEDILRNKRDNNISDKRIVTQSSAKVDESVKTIEDKVLYGQDVINEWRLSITQNERGITLFCMIIGILFSYAINRCTGNINIPSSVYVLSAAIVLFAALLLIADGALPLIVLVRFAVSAFFGHYFMMLIVAIDGHYFMWFATDVCRYPFNIDVTAGIIAGICIGYIAKSFEEIRAVRTK